MIIKLLVDAGDMKPGPSIGQQLGPLGINIGKVISEVNKATSNFKGIKVPVSLDINTKTKDFTVEVGTPPVAELLKKESGIEKASGQPHKIKVANLALEQIVKIAQTKEKGMLTKDFKSAVKTVLGSCVSLGILVEGKSASEIIRHIDKTEFKEIIEKQKSEFPAEKKAKLDEEFEKIKAEQEEILKREAEEAAAAEAEKAEAAPEEALAEAEEKEEAPKAEEKAPEPKEAEKK